MLLMGDEMRRTQRGNNNAYCQDNEVSWLDWSLLDRHRDLHRFVRMLIGHRLRMMRARSEESLGTEPQRTAASRGDRLARCPARLPGLVRRLPQHRLHHSVYPAAASVLAAPDVQRLLGGSRLRTASVPGDTLAGWQRWIDTARESPEDIMDPPQRHWCAGRDIASRRAPSRCCSRASPPLPLEMKACRQHKCRDSD